MKFYNKLKFFIRLSLMCAIMFDMIVIFEAVMRNNTYILFLCLISIFVFIIPIYYTAYIFEKQKQQIDTDLYRYFDSIKNMIKGDCDFFEDLPDDFEKEIEKDKDRELYYNLIKENKKLFFELKNKDKLLDEILFSTIINRDTEKFLADIMPKIINITQSQFIVFYMVNKITNKLEIKSSIGFGKSIYSQFDMNMGEGFLGKAAIDNKVVLIKEVNDDSIYVTKTFLGDIKPKNIIAAPINDIDDENDVLCVFAMGSVYEYSEKHIAIVEDIRKYMSYAIINGTFYNKSLRVTNELKFQNQLIQNLNENLEFKIKERTGVLNNIFNSMEEYFIISVDIDGNINMINDGAVSEFDIIREEFIGKNMLSLPNIEAYIKDTPLDCINDVLKKGKTKITYTSESNNDKVGMSIETEVFPVKNEYNEITGVTFVMKDISHNNDFNVLDTDKKLIEFMLEESDDSLIIINEEYEIEGVSKNAEYLIGINRKEAYGIMVWDIFTEKQKVRAFVDYAFKNKDAKNFNTVAVNTKININMKVKLIGDENGDSKKLIIYL